MRSETRNSHKFCFSYLSVICTAGSGRRMTPVKSRLGAAKVDFVRGVPQHDTSPTRNPRLAIRFAGMNALPPTRCAHSPSSIWIVSRLVCPMQITSQLLAEVGETCGPSAFPDAMFGLAGPDMAGIIRSVVPRMCFASSPLYSLPYQSIQVQVPEDFPQ